MERISKNKYKVDKNGNKKEKKKLTKKQKIIIAVSIVAALLIIGGIVFATYVSKADGDIANAAINMFADIVGTDEPITVLVVGISEGIEVPLTDTMLLCGYNPQAQQAFMVSIPRDTYIGTNDNYADGYSKINSAYQKGIDNTVKQVEKITGVEVNHYVVIKTSALVQIVDAIGGVEFDVPIDMDYDDPTQNLHIHLKAGKQKINGADAERLLRFRHNNDGSSYPISYGDNDYGRMRTQREFIMETAKQMIAWDNIAKLKDVATAIFANLETDMSLAQMISYIPSVLEFDMASLRTEQLPGQSERINKLWFYTHNLTRTKKLMTELMTSLGLDEKTYAKLYTPISTVSKRIKKVEEEENVVDDEEAMATCPHNWTSEITEKATCRKTGTNELTCSLCKKTKTETIDKLSHKGYEKETSREEATTVDEGTIYYKCTAPGCDATWTVEIPKKDSTNTNTNTSTNNNSSATETPSNSVHTTHDYSILVSDSAKCNKPGEKTYQCSYNGCTATQTKASEPTGKHTYVDGKCTECEAKDPNANPGGEGETTGGGSGNGETTGENAGNGETTDDTPIVVTPPQSSAPVLQQPAPSKGAEETALEPAA